MSHPTYIKTGDMVELHMLVITKDPETGTSVADVDTIFKEAPVMFEWGGE